MPTTVVIVNEAAGLGGHQAAGRRAAEALGGELRVAGPGRGPAELAREAVASGARLVVAGGGDGTVSAVAAALADTGVVLGVLPLGTLNHFAQDLRLPLALEPALAVLKAGKTVNVDVGEVNGRVFVNNASLGLYPEIVAGRLWHQGKGLRKWPAFLVAALGVLRRFPLLELRLDGHWTRTPFVFVGNNVYATSGPGFGRRACLDAGCLCLVSTRVTSRLGLLKLLLPGRVALDEACVPEAGIESRRPRLRVALDGEVAVLKPPLKFRVRQGALRVVVEG
jgi:diacylglycerol kinase family enzyme